MKRMLARAYRAIAFGDPWLLCGMLLLVLYYVSTRGVFQGKASGDGWFGFMYLRAIVFQHTLDMKAVIPEYLPYFSTSGPHHVMPNRCPFGPVLVWLPFYLVGIGVAFIGQALHVMGRVNGGEPFFAWFTGLGTLTLTLIGYRAVHQMLSRHVGITAARIGAAASVWATPIAWYAVTQPAYQHGLAFGLVALLVERWDAHLGKPDPWRFVWLGLLGGLAMEMREQEALFLLLPGVEAAVGVVRGGIDRRRWLACGIVLCAATLLAFAPQLAVWHYYTGAFQPPQVEPLRWSTPFILVSLFSTRGGLFSWSPIAYAATVGLFLIPRFSPMTRRLSWSLLALFFVEVYVVASAWVITSGYAYGARRLSDGGILLGLGVALAWERAAPHVLRKRVLVAFIALCFALNLIAMELVRWRRVPSSGGYARTAGQWLLEAHAPPVLARFFERVGYPFVQPFGYLFALYHHAPVSAFEGVVGNFMLDRDGQWFTVLLKSVPFDKFNHAIVVSGLSLADNAETSPAVVTGPVRLLMSMFASEAISVQLIGTILPGDVKLTWNDNPVPLTRTPTGLQFTVPATSVKAGVNELSFELPVSSKLRKMDFNPTTQWWKK